MMTGEAFAQKNQHIELEVDPIAYALKGYSLHLIYVKQKWRTDLGVFAIEQPKGYGPNDGYSIYSSGLGLKFNRLINVKETVFAGIGMGYVENRVLHIQSSETAVSKVGSIGIHAGYRWFPFKKSDSLFPKGLYLTPWASLDYNNKLNSVQFENTGYKQAKWSIFPTVHIGFKF